MHRLILLRRARRWFALFLTCLCASLSAQQEVPFSNGAPVAPEGLEIPALPTGGRLYDTAEGMRVAVHVEASGLEHPWSIAFLPGGDKLVTERNSGRLRLIRDGVLQPEPVSGVPDVVGNDYTGLLDLALHPDFSDNHLLYFTYSKPLADQQSAIAVGRGRWDGQALQASEDVFVADPGTGAGSRLVFGSDGMLYFSLFGGGEDAQDPQSQRGKVLRITPDGDIPADNPFVDREGYRPEIFTLGHRTITGLAEHPGTGRLWAVEMGPNGGDEINILKPGGNYGWPEVSLGRTYPGPWQSENFQGEGFIDPIAYWMPAISVSGLAFYTGEALSDWTGDVFVGGLRYAEVPGTGRLQRILINRDMEELRREDLLLDLRRRIRDVRQGPDGLLYVLTDDDNGALLRIEPRDWTPPTTSWGEPDLSGMWPIDHINQTPVQRPTRYGDRRYLTDEEYAERVEELDELAARYEEEDASNRMAMGHWVESGDPNRLTSLIYDPENGRVPPLTQTGNAMSATMTSSWDDMTFTSIDDFNALERCISRGLPASMFPFMYNSGIQILQSPDHVVINLELIHEARIIPLDRGDIPSTEIRQWMGISRGHWDGNTLVIETSHFNGQSPMLIVGPGGTKIPTSESLKIVERLTPTGPDTLQYEIRVSDPVVLTDDWAASYPWKRNPDYAFFEYACHEDNRQIRYMIEMGDQAVE